jgi:hypothetical protein
MRDIHNVLTQIINAVPYDFERRAEMERRFQSIKDSAAYTLPDCMGDRWHEAQMVLLDCLGPEANNSKLSWTSRIVRIWTQVKD